MGVVYLTILVAVKGLMMRKYTRNAETSPKSIHSKEVKQLLDLKISIGQHLRMSTSNLTFQVTTALLPYSRVYQMYIKPTSPSDQYDQHVAHPQKYYPNF